MPPPFLGPKPTQRGPWANDNFADREVLRMDGTPVAGPKRVDIAVQDQFQGAPAAQDMEKRVEIFSCFWA